MQDTHSNKFTIDHLTSVFTIFQILFIIAIVVSVTSQLGKSSKIEEGDYEVQPHIYIDNLSENILDFPSEYIDVTQALLLDIVQNNDPDLNLADTKAEVRDGAVYQHYFSRPNIDYISAVIDIPAISQSYQLFFQYSNDEQNEFLSPNDSIAFLCIENPADIIYQDFDCKDIYSQKTRNVLAAKYLPFFDFEQFEAGINTENYNQVNIIPNSFEQVDEKLFLEETKQAIDSLGISSSLFDYYIYKPEDINYHIEF